METLRVLVADDEAGMRAAIERVLGRYTAWLPDVECEVGFDVSAVETGEEALDAIRSEQPHILLLDYKLPGMSGLEVLQQIGTEHDGAMLTVMMTAYASIEAAVTATKRGAYDFLAKPFSPEELKNTIRKAAGRLVLARRARTLAEEKRQVRFEFIRILTHELKAPLAAVQGYLQIIDGRLAGDDQATYDHMVKRSLIRLEGMRKLIADLLDLTRIESGQKQRKIERVDVREVARNAVEGANAAQGGEIRIELHGDEPVLMDADAEEVEIILNNLVSNAVKYNRPGGRVDVSIADAPDAVTVTVADTGIGMTPEEAATLFGDFVRIKNEKTREILGSGLGLSIVRKLVLLYDGDASVESAPDVGSTFTVTLKRRAEPDASPDAAEASQAARAAQDAPDR